MANVEFENIMPVVSPLSKMRRDGGGQGLKSPTEGGFPPAVTISPSPRLGRGVSWDLRPFGYQGQDLESLRKELSRTDRIIAMVDGEPVYAKPIVATLSPPVRIGSPPWRKEEFK